MSKYNIIKSRLYTKIKYSLHCTLGNMTDPVTTRLQQKKTHVSPCKLITWSFLTDSCDLIIKLHVL